MPSFYTVDQIADLIDMHPKTIRRYIQDGKLKATKLGKQYRVANNDLNHFMGQQSQVDNSHSENNTDRMPTSSAIDTSLNGTAGTDQHSIEVSSTLDIKGVNGAMAANMTRQIMNTVHKSTLSHADCIYYSNEAKLKVLLFGSVEFTDQMMKHINILLSQSQTSARS
ncbi:helix-turn-helix domain-containing protein [Aurantivibrio infirmus]